jgi:adenylate cyclase
MGDGLMAIFGAPQALPGHAARAVKAGLDMIAMMARFGAEQVAAGRAPLKIGIGIATGERVAGYTGTDSRATCTCIGNTVNLASRLEAPTKAAQCAILIDGATQAALGGDIQTEALGPLLFKGKAEQAQVFAVRT